MTQAELAAALAATQTLAVEPELQFKPDRRDSHEAAARTLDLVEESGVTNFGFVGNGRYRPF